jgi:formylglycine-generating enzyme required for sulfatase activity
MVGNVSDWCHPDGSDRKGIATLRGGNWALTGDPCRLSIRRFTSPTYVSDRFGFRLKLALEA